MTITVSGVGGSIIPEGRIVYGATDINSSGEKPVLTDAGFKKLENSAEKFNGKPERERMKGLADLLSQTVEVGGKFVTVLELLLNGRNKLPIGSTFDEILSNVFEGKSANKLGREVVGEIVKRAALELLDMTSERKGGVSYVEIFKNSFCTKYPDFKEQVAESMQPLFDEQTYTSKGKFLGVLASDDNLILAYAARDKLKSGKSDLSKGKNIQEMNKVLAPDRRVVVTDMEYEIEEAGLKEGKFSKGGPSSSRIADTISKRFFGSPPKPKDERLL